MIFNRILKVRKTTHYFH